MKNFTVSSLTLLLLSTTNSYAGIISKKLIDTHIGNGSYANLQGLEWLTLDETAGKTRGEIEADYNGLMSSGWRYASEDETETLLTSLWGGNYDRYSSDNAPGANWFGQVFGFIGYGGIGPDDVYNSDAWTNMDRSYFYFGSREDECVYDDWSCYGQVSYGDNYAYDFWNTHLHTNETHINYAANSGPIGFFSENHGVIMGIEEGNRSQYTIFPTEHYGSLLVRETTSISEPSLYALTALGVFSLVATRKTGLSSKTKAKSLKT